MGLNVGPWGATRGEWEERYEKFVQVKPGPVVADPVPTTVMVQTETDHIVGFITREKRSALREGLLREEKKRDLEQRIERCQRWLSDAHRKRPLIFRKKWKAQVKQLEDDISTLEVEMLEFTEPEAFKEAQAFFKELEG